MGSVNGLRWEENSKRWMISALFLCVFVAIDSETTIFESSGFVVFFHEVLRVNLNNPQR